MLYWTPARFKLVCYYLGCRLHLHTYSYIYSLLPCLDHSCDSCKAISLPSPLLPPVRMQNVFLLEKAIFVPLTFCSYCTGIWFPGIAVIYTHANDQVSATRSTWTAKGSCASGASKADQPNKWPDPILLCQLLKIGVVVGCSYDQPMWPSPD